MTRKIQQGHMLSHDDSDIYKFHNNPSLSHPPVLLPFLTTSIGFQLKQLKLFVEAGLVLGNGVTLDGVDE